jgi:hypothetical protein
MNYESFPYHETSESLVNILKDRTQSEDSQFFRLLVGYYMCLAAAQMRCSIDTPDKGEIPVNMYVLNLAPSGFGKTMSMNTLEGEVFNHFRAFFLKHTFPNQAQESLAKLANERAIRKGTDPDDELIRVTKEFDATGSMPYAFDSGTKAAVRQLRHKLLMANAGSMNLIMDEVGANLSSNAEVFDTFIELFDKGLAKPNLLKNTSDSIRNEEIIGMTPANLMMFGVPNRLLDGAQTEEDMMTMLNMGYARRCFFGLVKPGTSGKQERTAEEMFDACTNQTNGATLEDIANKLSNMSDIINVNKKLVITRATCIELNKYQLDCEKRAKVLPAHQDLQKSELANRHFKVLKLAGAYAFMDESPEVTSDHIKNAIRVAEDSGEAFTNLLARDKPFVKLAKFIADVGREVTHADLVEELPFYKGSSSVKAEMMTHAIAYGYKNNIVIKKSFSDGIEFLRGESLKPTDTTKMIVSYSSDMTTDYRSELAPFDKLHLLTQAQGLHWVAHHLNTGYRDDLHVIPGFNMAVVDVDGGVNMSTAALLLSGYKWHMYTTKRHTAQDQRFRIVFPMNYELRLDSKDYQEFMISLYDWLPFDVDRQTKERSRKWLAHPGQYLYNDGELLDILPFIPKTKKNEDHKQLITSQQAMDNLERWVSNNIGDGNRNNMLLRYALVLLDGGFDFEAIRTRVMALNDKIADKLDEAELMATVMVTVARRLAKP